MRVDYMRDPSVRGPHPDGSYTIVSPYPDDDDWTVRDTGRGWEATHPGDGFDGALFASASDAVSAVLGDPALARRFKARWFGGAR